MSRQATDWAWCIKGLSATQRLVLLALANFTNQEHECWPSVSRLVDDTGLSERAVRGATADLSAAGYITKVERFDNTGRKVSASYYLRVVGAAGAGAPATGAGRQVQQVQGVGAAGAGHYKEPVIEPVNKNHDANASNARVKPAKHQDQSKARAEAAALAEGFERFWTRWPHKVSKRTAAVAWLKAAREYGEDVITGGLERALSMDQRFTNPTARDGRCVTPHAATWLNAQGFLDVHSPAKNNSADRFQPQTGGKHAGSNGRKSGGLLGAVVRNFAERGEAQGSGLHAAADADWRFDGGEVLDLASHAASTIRHA